MSTKKIYDLTIKNGEYTNSNGETKGRYINIGAVMQKDDGGKFIILDRHINLAGFPNPENRGSVIVSMFDVNRDSQQSQPEQKKEEAYDDSIPF